MVIGSTRYSVYVPGSKSWRASGLTDEDYRQYLYNPKRLAEREKIFGDYGSCQGICRL